MDKFKLDCWIGSIIKIIKYAKIKRLNMKTQIYFCILLFAIVSCDKDNQEEHLCKVSSFIYPEGISIEFKYEDSGKILLMNEYSDSLKTLSAYTRNYYNNQKQLYKIERYKIGDDRNIYFRDSIIIEYPNQYKTTAKKYVKRTSNSGPYITLDKTIEYFYNSKGVLVYDTTYKNDDYEHQSVKATKYMYDSQGNCISLTEFDKLYPSNQWIEISEMTIKYTNHLNTLKLSEPGPVAGTNLESPETEIIFSNNHLIEQLTFFNPDGTQISNFTYKMEGNIPKIWYNDGKILFQINYLCI